MEIKNPVELPLLIIIATIGVVFLLSFIILIVLLYQQRILAHKRLLNNINDIHRQKLLDTALEIAEKERAIIANNLHDDVGIALSALKIHLHNLQRNAHDKELVDETVEESNRIIDSSIEIVRSIYTDSLPPSLVNFGFIKGLKGICGQLNLTKAIKIDLRTNEDNIFFESMVQIQMFRIVKELLNNTIKHAKPSFIEIIVEKKENRVTVVILHNGIGVTTETIKKYAENSKGLGLKSIMNRTELIGAKIKFKIDGPDKSRVELILDQSYGI